LCNASKKEIEEDFWPHCGHLIDIPDINKSGANFQIEGDKIRAPLSLLQGIGPIAQKELNAGRPFTSIVDLCQKGAAKKVKVDGEAGRSAVHRGIATKLICSGVLDSLFEPDLPVAMQLYQFEAALATSLKKKSPEAVKVGYGNLKPLQRYQLRKGILTAYGENIIPMVVAMGVPGLVNRPTGPVYSFKNGHTRQTEMVDLVGAKALEFYQNTDELPLGGLRWAMAAYVIDEETVTYQGNKKMLKLVLDVEGRRQTYIKWPDKETGQLPKRFLTSFKGAIVLAIANRWKKDREATLDDAIVVEQPLVFKETENEDADAK
jgi:hypothetical protein